MLVYKPCITFNIAAILSVFNLFTDISLVFHRFLEPLWMLNTLAEQKEHNSICFRIGERSNGKLIDKSAAELQMNTSKSYKRRITAVAPLNRGSIAAVGRTNLESYWTITVHAGELLRS